MAREDVKLCECVPDRRMASVLMDVTGDGVAENLEWNRAAELSSELCGFVSENLGQRTSIRQETSSSHANVIIDLRTAFIK